MKKARPVTIQAFDIKKPITSYFFAQLCNIDRSAVTHGVQTGNICLDNEGLINCSMLKNNLYMCKKIAKSLHIGNEEERRYRAAVMNVLITHQAYTPEVKAQPFEWDKLKNEVSYLIGVMDGNNNDIFMPLITLYKGDDKGVEYTVSSNPFNISVSIYKNKLDRIFINDESAGDLYFLKA